MATLFTRVFWEETTDRALKSGAQAMLLAIGGGAVNVLTLDWATVLGAGGGGVLLSLLTSMASSKFGDRGTPMLLKRS